MSKINPLPGRKSLRMERTNICRALAASLIVCLCSVPMSASTNKTGESAQSAIEAPQSLVIKGKVVDAAGQPVIQASVLEKGTLRGTVTDMDGIFEMTVTSKDAVLEVSCIGYADASYPLGGA